MYFLLNVWRGIGTRLYMALGFAVVLTLVSSGVGVYYFERSGDLNHQAESSAVPALEASWAVARQAERLRALGLEVLSPSSGVQAEDVDGAIGRLEESLALPNGLPALSGDAGMVQDAAYGVADVIDSLRVNGEAAAEADAVVVGLRERLAAMPALTDVSVAGLRLLDRVLAAGSGAELDVMFVEFQGLAALGLEREIVEVGGGAGVFSARRQQLLLMEQRVELAASFEEAGAALEVATGVLLEGARVHSSDVLGLAVQSFDRGRVLLAVISLISVVAATLTAWLWVGNAVVVRLSALSQRMRAMALGDLETPVPEVGKDEIGQLAGALEHFRHQALEVQRLNLVERLYGELREANAELQRMQARLVAQEKLAALGELVSGVAHEISNPLNFVKNFSEGSLDLYKELSEMLEGYRDRMTDADASLLDELSGDITESLGRVSYNGGRALAIVERMRGLSVDGGTPVPADLNVVLQQAVRESCGAFEGEFEGFGVELEFGLDGDIGEQMLAERDFAEAVANLVSNACFAMHTKRAELGEEYLPSLAVSSALVGEVVEVRVRDNGPGVPPENVGRIFNPFFSTRDGALGAGLGLPIAADVVRRAGGDMVVETEFGNHAEFIMRLPVIRPVSDVYGDSVPEGIAEVVERMSAGG